MDLTKLPACLPGHWETAEGFAMAADYAGKERAELAFGDKPDLGLANAVYLVARNSLDLTALQTAAKERIRWLSVQLAIANARVAELETPKAPSDIAAEWGWWAGRDEEWFNYGGPFKTRERAIEEGRAGADGEGFYIIEAQQRRVRFSAESLIEAQYVENDDLFDSEHEEPDRRGDHEAADSELQALLDAWAEKHQATFVAPNLFAGQRNLEWIEAEAEEDDERAMVAASGGLLP